MKRRALMMAAAGGLVVSGGGAQAQPSAPIPRLKLLIPANAGGGWDQTGRALGEALLAAGEVAAVDYENRGGKGGVIGLQHFVEQHAGDPAALLVGGFVMVGSVALNQPKHGLDAVLPLARLTTELPVLVVRADSPHRDLRSFVAALRTQPAETAIAGGGAGGVDHMCAGMLARAVGITPAALQYRPFASGSEVMAAVARGQVAAGISGYGEVKQQIASGEVRALGIAGRRAAHGVESMSAQGVGVELGNWRGVFAPRALPADRVQRLQQAVQAATAHARWKAALQRHDWQSAWLAGAALREAIEVDQAIAGVLVRLLQLKPS